MLAYGRLRFSDGQRITSFLLDQPDPNKPELGYLACPADEGGAVLWRVGAGD